MHGWGRTNSKGRFNHQRAHSEWVVKSGEDYIFGEESGCVFEIEDSAEEEAGRHWGDNETE